MTRGRFVVFEGGEGSGKSTQAKLLSDHLKGCGIPAVLTREPGGTPGAESIRSLLLNPPGTGWGARAEALLFAAARSDHVEKLIEPAISSGNWVVCDRFIDSSRAYQGGAGKIGDEAILQLHDLGSGGLKPDLTILIDVPAEIVSARLAERDGDVSDAIGGRDAKYHSAVRAAFASFARADPERFVVIDGSGDVDVVRQSVLNAVRSSSGQSL